MRWLALNEEEARALVSFLYSVGYISHEFHPDVHPISKKLEEFVNDSSFHRNTAGDDEVAEEGSLREN